MALDKLRSEKKIELIISDIMMPEMDGITFYETLRTWSGAQALPFLFLTARASDEEKLRQLENGVLDYLVKPFSPDELRAKLASILEFQDRRQKEMEMRLMTALNADPSPQPPGVSPSLRDFGLSARETEVLEALLQGKSDKEIATMFGLSQRTASHHVANILKKTGKKSRVEVMRLMLGE